ncbi:non-ltr retroelement reverse transcriptase [Gossypium australe]|uniref:Non-ltr retroelement reverse transcriptase n=1 Tax=Gossypium australe TaxID=47621 RepID=A0A5B6X6R0_9ROSI|nr:non-ltr retroelement reverse transcriptase [Gossypium australe]
METKLSAKKMEMVRMKCDFENGIDVGSVGSKGGFYGNQEERNRSESWDLLRRLGQEQTIHWVVLGDSNEIVNSFEKKSGRLRADRQMDEFRTALDDCGLNDLGYIGRWFTWERGRFLSTNIRERLDRGVATLNWVNLCPSYQIEHLNHSFSYHCPILLDTIGKQNSFEEEIRRNWNDISGSVPDKLGKLGQQLQRWSRSKTREKKENRVNFEERLKCLYNQEPINEILAEIIDIQLGLNLGADQEEIFWEQRARVNLLENGDRNTSYFHKVVVQR